jgi:hypothetical protein
MKRSALAAAAAAAIVTAVAAGASSAPLAVRHVLETAQSGSIAAEFSYDYDSTAYTFANERLAIRRAGAVVRDGPIAGASATYEPEPANYFEHGSSVVVRDLDGDGEPEVLLDLYSGGAHCCEFSQVYRYAGGGYRVTTHTWWNPGVRLRDLDHDGLLEFVSGDNRFAYEFTDYADSAWPVKIWIYRGGRFRNVTQRYPAKIAADAATLWRWAFSRQQRGDNYGFLAAYAGDECALGRCAHAFARLETLRRAGRLRGHADDGSPSPYLMHLRRFLRETGYIR